MSEAKVRLGRVPCGVCGEPTYLKRNAAGTLSMSCEECDWSGFAKTGTAAAERLKAKLPKAPENKPAPEPTGEPAPKAPSKPARKGFSFEDL